MSFYPKFLYLENILARLDLGGIMNLAYFPAKINTALEEV